MRDRAISRQVIGRFERIGFESDGVTAQLVCRVGSNDGGQDSGDGN
jgi:hypothetical protein